MEPKMLPLNLEFGGSSMALLNDRVPIIVRGAIYERRWKVLGLQLDGNDAQNGHRSPA
jgi:hypothetical protein